MHTRNIRAHVYVKGHVQGVYFRQNTKDFAGQHSVTGWVRNLADGSVEAVLEGNQTNVREVVEWCHKGPANAKVENVIIAYELYSGEFQDFRISY